MHAEGEEVAAGLGVVLHDDQLDELVAEVAAAVGVGGVGAGTPGPVTADLRAQFRKLVTAPPASGK